jgi:hypothetical protein
MFVPSYEELYRIFYDLYTSCLMEFNMVLPSTSHGLEMDSLKQSSDEVCNCDSENEVDACYSDDNVSCVINSMRKLKKKF